MDQYFDDIRGGDVINSKERVRAAISGEPVDQVPLGFYLVDYDIIEKVIGRKTYVSNSVDKNIALWEGRREEVAESLKTDTVEFYKKIDCVDLLTFKEATFLPPKDYEPDKAKKLDDETWQTESGYTYKLSRVSNDFVCVDRPTNPQLEDFTVEMYDAMKVEDITPPDNSVFEACDHLVSELGAERYIAGSSGGMSCYTLIGSQEIGFMLYALNPEVIVAANRWQVREQAFYDNYYLRPGQDGVLFEQDMAGTNGTLISPQLLTETGGPTLKARVTAVKDHGLQALLHCCGDSRAIIDMLVDGGIECYQSLQTNAGMGLDHLNERWGDKLSFWGGIATELLVAGTADEVRKNVREAMEMGKRGRGFILGPSHSFAYGTKYDNFMAAIDEYHKHC